MRSAVALSLALNVVCIVAIVILFTNYPFVDSKIYEYAHDKHSVDAIQVAMELGRLDFVSLVVSVFGILGGFAAIFGFIEIRGRAERKAIEAATPKAEEIASQEVRKLLPSIIRRLLEEAETEKDKLGIDDPKEDRLQKMIDALDGNGEQNG